MNRTDSIAIRRLLGLAREFRRLGCSDTARAFLGEAAALRRVASRIAAARGRVLEGAGVVVCLLLAGFPGLLVACLPYL